MNQQEKKEFIEEFLNTMKTKLLDSVPKMPDDWDGFELRWLISDIFSYEQMGMDNKNRRKEYKNTIMVNNII